MQKARDIAIALLFSLVLLGPLLIFVCEAVHIDVPTWASARDADYLSGGLEEPATLENLSLAGFASTELQNDIADEVGNRIPFKATVMLTNAALQRDCIAVANLPFGWSCYPTYFDSAQIYIPSQDALSYRSAKRDEEQLENLRAFGLSLAECAARHPDKRFVVVAVKGYRDPAVNPSRDLVSNARSPQEQVDAIREGIGDCSNVFLVSESYGSLDEYYGDFFRTDHHWNHKGIERAYNSVARELGLAPFESPGEIGFDDYRYSGATARASLDLVSEEVHDTSYAFDELTLVTPEGEVLPYDHRRFFDRTDPGKRYQFYDSYYNIFQFVSEVRGPGAGKAVVLGNSYGAGIVRYLALNYEVTAVFQHLHPSHSDPANRMDEVLRQGGYDDVFLVANCGDIDSFAEDCPNYFDEV